MKKNLMLGAAALALACEGQIVEYTTEQPIINGEVAAPGQFPAVGFLSLGGGLCTGTLIEPDWVLTAAHCTAGVNPNGDGTTFGLGNSNNSPTQTIGAKRVITHPQFRADAFFLGNDIALVELDAAVTGVTPIPFNTTPLADVLQLGGACDTTKNCFTAVGFGNDNGTAGTGSGTKRFVDIQINSINEEHVNYGLTGTGNTCQGDSGGPSFMTINGQLRIIGVTSGGAPGCGGDSFNQRTDSENAEFLDGILNGGIVVPPPTCVDDDGECDEGCGIADSDCNCQRDGFCQAASLCPAGVERDPDCPDPNSLVPPDEGCAVSPASETKAPLAIFALAALAFASLGLRRRNSRSRD